MEHTIPPGDMVVTVGNVSERIGSYNDFYDFRAWVVHHVAKGELVEFRESGVPVYLWDRRSEQMFPHLLSHQECGQYLPLLDVDPQPRIGSSIHLLQELLEIEPYQIFMPDHLKQLFEIFLRMTRLSVNAFEVMELGSIALTYQWR